MRVGWVVLIGAAGCADEPGACVELVAQGGNVATSWCSEVERADLCPYRQSAEAWRWEWHPGETCAAVGYDVDCGADLWEDLASECG